MAGFLVAADDAHGLGGDRLLRLIGGRADVVRAVDAGQRHEIVGECPGRARRFVRVDIEADAQAALLHRRLHGRVVDDLAARRIHENRSRLHARQQRGVHEMLRALTERDVDADDVASGRGVGG